MTVQYRMADGNVVDVEASSEVAEMLAVYERQDASERRKARRHNEISLDAVIESCAWEPIDTVDIETAYIEQEEKDELVDAIKAMNEDSRDLIHKLFYECVPARTVAANNNITFQAVYKRLNKILAGLRQTLAA